MEGKHIQVFPKLADIGTMETTMKTYFFNCLASVPWTLPSNIGEFIAEGKQFNGCIGDNLLEAFVKIETNYQW